MHCVWLLTALCWESVDSGAVVGKVINRVGDFYSKALRRVFVASD